MVTGRGCFFKIDAILKTKLILIDLTITNPCGNTLLDCSAKQSGHAIRKTAYSRNNKL